jgi:hypothetical protein
MPPKKKKPPVNSKFVFVGVNILPEQLDALRARQNKVGAPISELVRRALTIALREEWE